MEQLHPSYLNRPGRRAPSLRVERVLGGMGISRAGAAGRRQFEREMEERRAQVEIALKLRTETTMTLNWIAARLQMGTGASLSNLLSARRRLQQSQGIVDHRPTGVFMTAVCTGLRE